MKSYGKVTETNDEKVESKRGNHMSEEKKGFFQTSPGGSDKNENNIVAGIDSIFSGFSSIDDDFYEEIEEILVMGVYWYQYHNIYY